MSHNEYQRYLKHNLSVNILDGGFFGLGLGFSSFVTILPLFVGTMTKNALLIGLIPAIHNFGWQFPQLFTAYTTSRQTRYLSLLNKLTIHERLPFFFLAIIAWLSPKIGVQITLTLTFILLVWQGVGGGLTGTAWQSMVGKIFPADIRGTFYGAQAAAANLFASISAVFAGLILERLVTPLDFTLCFLITTGAMMVSWFFLAQTHESATPAEANQISSVEFRTNVGVILRSDKTFRWYLVARILAYFGTIAFAFYAVYAVQVHQVSEFKIGLMTASYMATQILANPVMGWLGDRTSHRYVMVMGMLSASVSALTAWLAPTENWFFLVFILAGIGNVALWTSGLAMILQFGTDQQRPVYIGLSNTLVAPATILAPLLAGLIANMTGYSAAFIVSALGAIAAAGILAIFVTDPHKSMR
jgi:MFS family permease